jgi:hypothetical protein
MEAVDYIRSMLIDPKNPPEVREIFKAQLDDINNLLYPIENAYKKFISNMVGHTMQQEIDKQCFELFPDTTPNMSKIHYVRMKIIYEWTSSFLKLVENSWISIFSICKIFNTYPATQQYYKDLEDKFLKPIHALNIDIKALLTKIETKFDCKIVGSYTKDKEVLVSNLIYEEEKDYDFNSLFPQESDTQKRIKAIGRPFVRKKVEDYYYTSVIGTKEWNRNDAYILCVKADDLKEEEKKFYSSSFIIQNPSENANINLAAAMVRKNAGFSAAPKYNKMVMTLLEFASNNLFTKDFVDVCEDTTAFLYHTGPVVMWNIIQEDMHRRDFGFCYYVEKNSIIRFFPENIIKKNIIDFWAEKFFNLKASQVDSYINYSKGVSSIRESYKQLFDQAAATKRRTVGENKSVDEYLRENTGKFFGYRRAQVYRRFVHDTIWGILPEITTTELVQKFAKK